MEGIGGVAEDAKEEEETEVAVDDEDDEIEYMAPTAVGECSGPPLFISFVFLALRSDMRIRMA